ncbi:hypothetical protein M758_4G119300 [Ceratodon purpureus]|nr:hypothetical protein M758_4G119300 [Ceratodon purpureus]
MGGGGDGLSSSKLLCASLVTLSCWSLRCISSFVEFWTSDWPSQGRSDPFSQCQLFLSSYEATNPRSPIDKL